MSTKKPRNHTSDFKAKVALEAIRGDLTLNEISKKYGVHATQINRWKQQALGGIKSSFNGKQQKAENDTRQLTDDLYRQIGQLTCENEFLKKRVWE
jgi:transposase